MKIFYWRKYLLITMLFCLPVVVQAASVCTGPVKIKELKARHLGWVHVVIEGIYNADIKSCGNQTDVGLLLNYNDSTGSVEGKKMLLAMLMSAKATGKNVRLCSDGCDTQHPAYSRLSHLDEL